ncbi:hypothetical protein [Aquimarina pacifica]|uniref:hypothetical protein n=1 Tax=Aquimarina pacifica TaxID=1296415 RepID=UPI0004B362B0|nr:hypothetical protein [Aquimarina pacifica]
MSNTLELEEENITISEEDAYTILIKQKLQELIDKRKLAQSHPDFELNSKKNELFSQQESNIKEIKLITPFTIVSDSVKTITTAVVFDNAIDTVLSIIKTSTVEIEKKQLKMTKVTFDTLQKLKIK